MSPLLPTVNKRTACPREFTATKCYLLLTTFLAAFNRHQCQQLYFLAHDISDQAGIVQPCNSLDAAIGDLNWTVLLPKDKLLLVTVLFHVDRMRKRNDYRSKIKEIISNLRSGTLPTDQISRIMLALYQGHSMEDQGLMDDTIEALGYDEGSKTSIECYSEAISLSQQVTFNS